MTEPPVTPQTALGLGLSEEEYERIEGILGRTPSVTELSIYAVMWSEQYSCKNSALWLKTLPREGQRLLADSGVGGAGLVDIGGGLACAFRIESRMVETQQDFARDLHGIHHGIVATGARPLATMLSIQLGNAGSPDMRQLVRSMTNDIDVCANGSDTVTGGYDVYFRDSPGQSTHVDILTAGIVRVGETVPARADGPGNPVFVVSSATGTNVAFQAGALSPASPLLEATLEAIQTGAIGGMANIGPAGIAAPATEMSARSHAGMRIELDKAPRRLPGMYTHDNVQSLEPDGLLIVGIRGLEQPLHAAFTRPELLCEQIGEVTDTGRLECYQHGERVADIPVASLVRGGGAPVYKREYTKPAYLQTVSQFKAGSINRPDDLREVARRLVRSPNIAPRRWRGNRNTPLAHPGPGDNRSDAAVVPISGASGAIALSSGCYPAYVYADPYTGAMITVAGAARRIVCSGGEPLALTHNLTFGNPQDPEMYWQFVHAIKGIAEACRKLNIPVTGGKVHFSAIPVSGDRAERIFPNPVIGMTGILENPEHQMTCDFKSEGRAIYMIGTPSNDIAGSGYLRLIHGIGHSPAPRFDPDEEYHTQQNLKALVRRRMIESAHAVSEGGLFFSLLESALVNGLGFDIETDDNFRKDAYLFGESQGRVVLSVVPDGEDDLVNYLNTHNVSFTKLGDVSGERLIIDGVNYGQVSEWNDLYNDWLARETDS